MLNKILDWYFFKQIYYLERNIKNSDCKLLKATYENKYTFLLILLSHPNWN